MHGCYATAEVWYLRPAGLELTTIGVGTAGATGALAPAMVKPRGRKYLFAPAIICKVYLLVDSQSCISLYSFKIFNLYSELDIFS